MSLKTRTDYVSTGGRDFTFKFGDSLFFGAEDFLVNTDPSTFEVQHKETGEVITGYEFMWKFISKIVKDTYENDQDEDIMSPEEWDSLEEWTYRTMANSQKQEQENEKD